MDNSLHRVLVRTILEHAARLPVDDAGHRAPGAAPRHPS